MAESQFETTRRVVKSLPSWVADKEEQLRIASYAFYEDVYWTIPDTFKLTQRGSNDKPIYVPSGKVIVETIHRFMAKGLQLVPDPNFGETAQQLLAQQVITDITRREKFYSRFNAAKRFGIIRGDWAFMLWADPNREPGSKLSILSVSASKLFPIFSETDPDELIGWDVVDLVKEDDKDFIHRIRYLKQTMTGGPSPIVVTDELYKTDQWGGPGQDKDPSPERTVLPPQVLPAPIDQLPIYLIRNFEEEERFWGASELKGIETLMGAINQSVSDEELSLALDGLGVYVTDAGTPVNDDNEEVPWNLGPGRVIEVPDGKQFKRVTGTTSVAPYQEHLAYLHGQIDESTAMSDVAKGRVDVNTAESGVALAFQLAPLFARADEKDLIITDVLSNMMFDFGKWMVAYEGSAFNSLVEATRIVPVYGDRMPLNKEKSVKEILELVTAKVISPQYARARLRSLGYDDMPDEATIANEIIEATRTQALATQDAFGARVDAEVDAELNAGE